MRFRSQQVASFTPQSDSQILCDSLLWSILPHKCLEDTISFLRYYYPEIEVKEWKYDDLHSADRFQDATVNPDCGLKMLDFMHAALKNARIQLLYETFNQFKARTDRKLKELKSPIHTQSTSSSNEITENIQTQQE